MPGRDAGTGERRRFFIREMLGDADHAFLIENHVLRQQPLGLCAQRRPAFVFADFAAQPFLHEDAGHAVADLHAAHASAHGYRLADAVGEGNQRQTLLWIVDALDHHQVAVVQRKRPHLKENLSRPGFWLRPLGQGQ